jgi:hypothetical protein
MHLTFKDNLYKKVLQNCQGPKWINLIEVKSPQLVQEELDLQQFHVICMCYKYMESMFFLGKFSHCVKNKR